MAVLIRYTNKIIWAILVMSLLVISSSSAFGNQVNSQVYTSGSTTSVTTTTTYGGASTATTYKFQEQPAPPSSELFTPPPTDELQCIGGPVAAGGGCAINRGFRDGVGAPKKKESPSSSDGSDSGSGEGSGSENASGGAQPPAAGQPDPQVEMAIQQAEASQAQCQQRESEATNCCQNPMSCLSGASPQGAAAMSQVLSALAAGAMASQKSIQDACNMMSLMGGAGAGANAGGAGLCSSKRNSCGNSCLDTVQQFESAQQACTMAGAGCSPDQRQRILQGRSVSMTVVNRCDALRENVAAMSNQAGAGANAAMLGQLCAQASASQAGQGTNIDTKALTAMNCNDPAYASSPSCMCTGSNAQMNPLCRGQSGTSSSGSSAYSAERASSGSMPSIDTGDDISALNVNAPVSAGSYSSGGMLGGDGGVPSNGGGFGGGSGGPNGGGDQDGGDSGGYNTNVLAGYGSKSGYSNTPGGGRGPAGRYNFNAPNGQQQKGFDLKNYLPGGKHEPRRIASVTMPARELGSAAVDLFQRVSVRVGFMCRDGRVYDCKSNYRYVEMKPKRP